MIELTRSRFMSLAAFMAGTAALINPAASATATLDGSGAGSRIPACEKRLDDFDRVQLNRRRIVPEDCTTTGLAPPQFIWTEPGGAARDRAQPFRISISRGEVVIVRSQTLKHAMAFGSRDADWKPGDYRWTIGWTRADGARIESAARRFRIMPGAVSLDWPDGVTLAAKVAALPFPHVPAPGPMLRRAIAPGGEYGDTWNAFEGLARDYLSVSAYPLPPEPVEAYRHKKGSPESVAAGIALQLTAQNEQRIIQALAAAKRITGDQRFGAAARQRMRNLAAWSTMGAPVENSDLDLVNRAVYRALAEGLDVLWDEIDPSERQAWITVVRTRMQPILRAFEHFDDEPYSSHLIGETAIAVETLLHVAGMPGFPQAQTWLAEAWERYRFGFNIWGGEDGGFSNGVAYGWYSMEIFTSAHAALRAIGGVDLARHPYIANYGRFLRSFVTTAQPGLFLPFGDGVETTNFYLSYVPEYFRLHAALSRDPEDAWYWREHPQTNGPYSKGKINPWQFILAGLGAPVVARAPAQRAWLSADAGIAAIFSTSVADRLRSAVYFRSSRFGSVSHSHADQNAFTFDSHGRNLLISSGYYPWYGSAHHLGVTRLSRFKNALSVDGGLGQNEFVDDPTREPAAPGRVGYSMDNHGNIVNFSDGARYGVVTGDAALAYRPVSRSDPPVYGAPLVNIALRSIVYDRVTKVVLIYDHAESKRARHWELNFHALAPFESSITAAPVVDALRLEYLGVALCIDVHGAKGQFQTSNGFPVPPEGGFPSVRQPEQYHARFGVAERSLSFTGMTVLREDCTKHGVEVRIEGNRAVVNIDGGPGISFENARVGLPG